MDRTDQEITLGKSKKDWAEKDLEELVKLVEKDSWIALKQYFDGRGNGSEAKIAAVALGILAKKMQANNNARQLDIVERKMLNN